jgi:hypothetical protein
VGVLRMPSPRMGVIAPFPSPMPPVAHVERLRLSPLE